MLRSLYTAGTAMLTQSRRMDVITNNITNMETNGFRADTLVSQSFRDMLISRISDPSVYDATRAGDHNTGIHIDRVYTSFLQGTLESTDLPTDLALAGDGFFAVETPEGERYTRAGSFGVDAAGYLTTPLGQRVLGMDGPLLVGADDFTVAADGTVDVGGIPVGQLRTVTFPDNGLLRKEGDNLFFNLDPAANPPADTAVEVRQGYLEGSNVDSAREMVDMLNVYRSYEINQRILRIIDDSLGLAVNDIAKV
ncbi:MAG: flagellar basal-body rod protein FlgF [Oscillospiraceae bacterium]|jgi:flagellar basal-body rod protein FlgG|nr:flagellar basal-body rod protein FlgF [Oscillospiraceae bacterium]